MILGVPILNHIQVCVFEVERQCDCVVVLYMFLSAVSDLTLN